MTTTHKRRRREAKALDGRNWKTRRAGKYTGVISQIRKVKEKAPSAGDVMKAVATQQNETIDYGTAWRSLQGCEKIQVHQQIISFRRIIPFLKKLNADNPDSKIFSEKDPTTNRIKRLFVCPSFMNETIKSVIPVISLDGAHIRDYCG